MLCVCRTGLRRNPCKLPIRPIIMSGLGLNLPNLISLARLLLVPLEIWLILVGHYGLAMLVSVYITLGAAHQLWTSLVILVVFRDVMIVGGFLLIQLFAVPKHYEPLYISKLNTGVQIMLVGFVLARLGLGAAAGQIDLVLSLIVGATTVVSGLSYLVRWARLLARSEQAL